MNCLESCSASERAHTTDRHFLMEGYLMKGSPRCFQNLFVPETLILSNWNALPWIFNLLHVLHQNSKFNLVFLLFCCRRTLFIDHTWLINSSVTRAPLDTKYNSRFSPALMRLWSPTLKVLNLNHGLVLFSWIDLDWIFVTWWVSFC